MLVPAEYVGSADSDDVANKQFTAKLCLFTFVKL